MAEENNPKYNHHPTTIDEAVKGARDFLKNDPEEIKKRLKSDDPDFKRERIRVGAKMIFKFFGGSFNLTRIQDSLHRLKLIEEGVVDVESIYKFPNSASAMNFCKIVKELNVNKDDQKRVAEKLEEKGTYGERSIYQTAQKFTKLTNIESLVGGFDNTLVRDVVDPLQQATRSINTAVKKLNEFKKKAKFRGVFPDYDGAEPNDIPEKTREAFHKALDKLSACIEEFDEFFRISET